MVASQEAYAHDEYKQRIVAASARGTTRTTLFGPEWPDQPIRVIRNRVVNEWSGREAEAQASSEPGQVIGQTMLGGQATPMPKFSALLPTPDTTGDFEEMCLIAGESVGLIHEVRPAKEIIASMMNEAKQIIEQKLYGNDVLRTQ